MMQSCFLQCSGSNRPAERAGQEVNLEPRSASSPIINQAGAIALILLASLFIKVVFIWHLEGRVYGDVSRAIHFGYSIDQQILSIHTDFIRNKTFLGPTLWFYLYQSFGILGLKLFNLLIFALLFLTQYFLGRTRYSERGIVIALFLFAFYVGTNRNVVAGEPDDNLAVLFFSLGILVYVNRKRSLYSSLLMGLGFLFKFWVAVFFVGFVLYLLTRKFWRDFWLACVGMLLPFLIINCVDGFESMRGLLISLGMQRGYSDWGSVGYKMLSTGLAPSVLISGYAWLKNRNEQNTLFFFVPSTYFIYVIIQRDAFAASFVMMLCMVFSSFVIAEFILRALNSRGLILGAIFAIYLALTSAITYQNLYWDTEPFALITDPSEIRRMFP